MYSLNIKKLNGKIVAQGTTQEALADALGIDRGTLRRRLNAEKLQIRDIYKIAEVLHLTKEECIDIFLS